MNYELLLIQKNIDEIDILPNIEDLYDMDKDSLLKVKTLLDKKFPQLVLFNEKKNIRDEKNTYFETSKLSDNKDNDLNLALHEDSFPHDLGDFPHNYKINGFNDDSDLDLPRLYSFLVSEIKQRDYQEGIVSFFLNEESLLKLTEDNFNFILETATGKAGEDLENDSKQRKVNYDETEKSKISSRKNENNETHILGNFDPSECSLKKIKEKLSSKSSKLAIKQMLMKTKQDNNKLLVGQAIVNLKPTVATSTNAKASNSVNSTAISGNTNKQTNRASTYKSKEKINLLTKASDKANLKNLAEINLNNLLILNDKNNLHDSKLTKKKSKTFKYCYLKYFIRKLKKFIFQRIN